MPQGLIPNFHVICPNLKPLFSPWTKNIILYTSYKFSMINVIPIPKDE